MKASAPKLLEEIRADWNDEIKDKLSKALIDFKKTYRK
jgi:hypothetical protein